MINSSQVTPSRNGHLSSSKEMLLQVSYKRRLLLAPSRWLRTAHLTHLPIPRWEGLYRS
eukprot:COSAG02_NODE_4627_length_5151_cov_2.807601_1_plen_58_part_10